MNTWTLHFGNNRTFETFTTFLHFEVLNRFNTKRYSPALNDNANICDFANYKLRWPFIIIILALTIYSRIFVTTEAKLETLRPFTSRFFFVGSVGVILQIIVVAPILIARVDRRKPKLWKMRPILRPPWNSGSSYKYFLKQN